MFILWKLIQSYWYKIFSPYPFKTSLYIPEPFPWYKSLLLLYVKSLIHWTPRRQAFAFSGGPLYFFPFKGLLDNATL